MKHLSTKSKLTYCIIFTAIVHGVLQPSFDIRSFTDISSEIQLTKQQYESMLTKLKSLQKIPYFKSLADQKIKELNQRWNEQNQAFASTATSTPSQETTPVATPQPSQPEPEEPFGPSQIGSGF